MNTKTLFEKHYDGESIVDLGRDVSEAITEDFNPEIGELPTDRHGFIRGTFRVVIEWTDVDDADLTVEDSIAEMPITKRRKGDVCVECGAPADFVRSTQFAGEHPYCREHALKEEDFGESDSSYFYWYRVE